MATRRSSDASWSAGVRPAIEIDHEHDQVGLGDCQSRLILDLLLDRVAGADLEAAGVDHDEATPVPLRVAVDSIASGAGAILHDRGPVADDPVEQGAFADVGAADYGHDR